MNMSRRLSTAALAVLAMAVGLSACDGSATDPPPPPPPGLDDLELVQVASGFNQPVYLTSPPGDARLFVVEKSGQISIVENGQVLGTPFLDIENDIVNGGEQGLLSMAFHPDYASNGLFYVFYTEDGNGDTRVERYTVSGDPNVADQNSASEIITVGQPFGNHNGGLVVFGPDGMLYIGLGDGGSGGDPQGHGQNLQTLLGAILRIDVDGAVPYDIPPGNPFVDDPNAADEIWAYGLRNPWRFAFDREPGSEMIYIGDVGQNRWEEVDVSPAGQGGLNYGWATMEGLECFQSADCDMNGLELPVVVYSIDGQPECAIVGGFVYRGNAIPGLAGHYFYSDNCTGWIRSFRYDNGSATDEAQWNLGDIGSVLSFGEDSEGELYVLAANGTVYRLEEPN